MVRLSRKVEFEASHFYRLPELSDEQNRARFGLAANPHGHNWVLHVTVSGRIAPHTGMVVNIKEIDAVLRARIVSQLDHKCLNLDHPAFARRLPTTENLALFIWGELVADLPSCDLRAVRLFESEVLFASYRGEVNERSGRPVVSLTRAFEFSASHRLHEPCLSKDENLRLYGKCNNPNGHGHNYRVEVTVAGEVDSHTGMIVDLDKLDAIVRKEVLDRLDYKHLNTDVAEFRSVNPTSENVVRFIYDVLAPHFREGTTHLRRVRLYETPKSWFDYGEPT